MPNDTLWSANDPSKFLILPESYDSIPPEAQLALRHLIEEGRYSYEKPISNKTHHNNGVPMVVTFLFVFFIPLLLLIRLFVKIKGVDYKITPDGERVPLTVNTMEIEQTEERPPYLIYRGSELHFPDDAIAGMLQKRFPFYNGLSMGDQTKFMARLKKFMAAKNFLIYDKSGFKEMPVLISASAIQVGFGLDQYMLPSFSNIHIFPDAFLGLSPFMRFLEGNVSGNNIHVSWKHFLNGYQFPGNGENLGLHEMAHAFHLQYFSPNNQTRASEFGWYETVAQSVFEREKKFPTGFYQEYYLKNMHEFWAGNVELFFEKPNEMKAAHEALYTAIAALLNQHPAG